MGHLWVDVEVHRLLKDLVFGLRIVEEKALFHNEESAGGWEGKGGQDVA